ncbi:MAG TPA: alpha-1,4-glucan--maltose-1-phosphate maltosyltransferase [Thermoanaerobaculia bacterium]|nr:alpha-1,4-glucan--maltose-1-phosphate maltosyltransferase [Thermoanaerobaculia bacterium]
MEGLTPEIDGGRFPIKRTIGEKVTVDADVFADGHDEVVADLLVRGPSDRRWRRVAMSALGNDRWRASFEVEAAGWHRYTVEGWTDPYGTWRHDLEKRIDAGQDVEVELAVGAGMLRAAADRTKRLARSLRAHAEKLEEGSHEERLSAALDPGVAERMRDLPESWRVSRYPQELFVQVDRERARFGAWYEMFPRSASEDPDRHGTFDDVIARLPYIKSLGFDVLYLAPIHPIGRAFRKGPNNVPDADPDHVGSPWAIGSEEGGHEAIHPELGSVEDFERLVPAANGEGIEIALDYALQCSPDHPWVKEHPEWFRHLPDGSIRYAENPPKKYQDIYPLDFETEDWRALWRACNDVLRVWIDRGVRIFRVDNPHTKPFAFWEWLIADVKADYPDVLFLAEAFTRPRRLERLAKLGFTQSYNYFPWRNEKLELEQYLTELSTPPVVEYLRANLWPNTPDILTAKLQHASQPAFAQRFVLAATLGASYGIYGPPFELMENAPRGDGSEEYLDSEKYQVRHWKLETSAGGSPLRQLIAQVNRIRHENRALQFDRGLHFHSVDSPQLLCYSKVSPERDNVVLVVVSLDAHWTQSGFTDLALGELGLDDDEVFEAHDLLTDHRFTWQGGRNYVELDPWRVPAHVFRLTSSRRSEDARTERRNEQPHEPARPQPETHPEEP